MKTSRRIFINLCFWFEQLILTTQCPRDIKANNRAELRTRQRRRKPNNPGE